jgi:hypothetical protein
VGAGLAHRAAPDAGLNGSQFGAGVRTGRVGIGGVTGPGQCGTRRSTLPGGPQGGRLAGQGKNPSAASGSATIVRVGSHRHLEVIQHGIHDAAFAGDTQRFLQHLIRRREHSRQ